MDDNRRFPLTPLEKARMVSQALQDAARRARFSARTRRNLSGGGFAARRGAAGFRLFTILSFWLCVVIPGAMAVTYYMYLASDQYQAEIQFTVAGGEPIMADSFTAVTGIPSITIIQDTQIVTNFLHSRAAVEKLQSKLDMRARYSLSEVDFWARFDPKSQSRNSSATGRTSPMCPSRCRAALLTSRSGPSPGRCARHCPGGARD